MAEPMKALPFLQGNKNMILLLAMTFFSYYVSLPAKLSSSLLLQKAVNRYYTMDLFH